mgnify:CR=1 FL=1|jgi:hypothetical protein
MNYDLPKLYADRAMKEADEQLRAQHKAGLFCDGDPNHPTYNDNYNYATGKYQLFGMDQDELMNKQYRK